MSSFLVAAVAVHAEKSSAKKAASNAPAKSPRAEAELAMKNFHLATTNLQISVFATEPMLENPVCFTFDEKGRLFVGETYRLGVGVIDNRKFQHWIDEELASKSVEDRLALTLHHANEFSNFTNEWTSQSERLKLIEDIDGDGKADKSTVFAEGFTNIMDGLGAGVLARKGDVYYTCMPNLYVMRDTDGDGKADTRKILSTGYGVRYAFLGHDLHGLRIGPDGKLYFSCGDRGLSVEQDGKKIDSTESGAVLRCNLDGSDLELFATGLRNPQELAFDDLGNLFAGDNNADHGDHARWVYLVEGGDSGWRVGYQYISTPTALGPWNAELLWKPQYTNQAAYIIPPVANVGNGPSGLTHYPGVGLSDDYKDHFFLCDFKGQAVRSLVHDLENKPKGAGFTLEKDGDFISDVLVTDVEFGPDSAVYISDWVNGWDMPKKGRIYKIANAEVAKSNLALETKKLINEGMEGRSTDELKNLLSHVDQRVRQEAQFALAEKGESSIAVFADVAQNGTNLLARVHAIWGLGQIASKMQNKSAALEPLMPLVAGSDAELHAQCARVLGDARYAAAEGALLTLLQKVDEPRSQFFAAMALGKIGSQKAIQPVIEMIRANNDRDAVLRHAGIMALANIGNVDAIVTAAKDNSPCVRLAAAVALRRLHRPEIAMLLQDKQQAVVIEAARAINDLPITEALPSLAALIDEPDYNEALFRRVINANFRLGAKTNAEAIAHFITRKDAPADLRAEGLKWMNEWGKPSGRDHISGLWRPVPQQNEADSLAVIQPLLSDLLTTSASPVRVEAARYIATHNLKDQSPALFSLLRDAKQGVAQREEALKTLAALDDPKLADAVKIAFEDEDPALRKEAIKLQSKLKSADASGKLVQALKNGTLGEKQAALAALGSLKDSSADQILEQWVDDLTAGKVQPELSLDVIEAAAKRTSAGVKEKLQKYNDARPKNDDLAPWRECLAGGNAEEGRKIFAERAEASCIRCHKVHGEGGEVGPVLDGVGTRQKREYLLESVVFPNKQIAPGFETVIVTLKNGTTYAGTVKSQDKKELVLNSPEDGIVKVKVKDIQKRDRGMSGMPPNFTEVLSKQDMRNVVEFLSSLKN